MGLIPSSMRVPLPISKIQKFLPVGSRNSTKPVERIRGGSVGNTVERNLTADQVDEKGNNSPEATLTERNLHVIQAL